MFTHVVRFLFLSTEVSLILSCLDLLSDTGFTAQQHKQADELNEPNLCLSNSMVLKLRIYTLANSQFNSYLDI